MINRTCAAHCAQFVDLRLHVTSVINRTGLQDGGSTVPYPIDVEARQALGIDRAFQSCGAPVAPTIDRYVDTLDLAAP
ncbi:hypothetical protein D3C84_1207810 [compost metagenome]